MRLFKLIFVLVKFQNEDTFYKYKRATTSKSFEAIQNKRGGYEDSSEYPQCLSTY